MKRLFVFLAILFATFAMYSCKEKPVSKEESHEGHSHEKGGNHEGHNHAEGDADENVQKVTYKCKTDCEKGKTYDAKGNCPVCKMELVAVEEKGHEGHDHSKEKGHEGHEH